MPDSGILLINLGSPDSPSEEDVRKYLREFLMDGRVLDAPYPVRFAVVHGFILPFRPKVSAEAYRKVWTAAGSPLITISRSLREKLHQRLDVPVGLAMRYQSPTIDAALTTLVHSGVNEVLVVPLFPHYAMSSYESAVERVKQVAARVAPGVSLQIFPPYFDRAEYIHALVQTASTFLNSDYDHLLFSFHGVPERHLRKSDPTGSHCLTIGNCCDKSSPAHDTCYRRQCLETMKLFAEAARLPKGKYSYAFQSRLGRDAWLQPFTQAELTRLATSGVRKLLVICPAFTVDCLETIEEIGMRGRDDFLKAGGKEFTAIPCLNDQTPWVEALATMLGRQSRAVNASQSDTITA